MEMGLRAAMLQPTPSACPPVLNVGPPDVAGLNQTLLACHQEFAPLFVRREQRHWALKYLEGQLLAIKRTSIDMFWHVPPWLVVLLTTVAGAVITLI